MKYDWIKELTKQFYFEKTINKVYNTLVEISDVMSDSSLLKTYIKCDGNSIADIRVEFDRLVMEEVEARTLVIENEELFETYNILTDEKFYKEWSDKMFEYVYNELKNN